MQCTSYIPVFHSRDLNVGSSGVPWHLFNGKANYGEEIGYNISLQPLNELYLSHDKVVLRQIIENHDATFRHQVQELHRLYQKQRELMNEMRAKSVFLQRLPSQPTLELNHSLSHALSDISHATSRPTALLLGDRLDSKPPGLTPEKNPQKPHKVVPSIYFHQHVAAVEDAIFTRNGSYYNEVGFPFTPFESNRYRNSVIDLDPTSGICRDDKRIQFSESKFSQACKNIPEIRPTTHDPRMSRECPVNLVNEKNHFFIDLNQPIEALQQSVLPDDLEYHYSNRNSGSTNSPVVIIDLNSMPVGCFPETKTNLEHVSTVENETPDEHLLSDLVEKPGIDLNTDVIPNRPPSPMAQIEFIEPVSPENEETCPPRGKCMSEDRTRLQRTSYVLSKRENGEPLTEIDNDAAETLVSIFSCEAHGRLSWFAKVVSAFGNDLEREIEKLENGTNVDQGGIFSVFDNNAEKDDKGHAGGKRRRNDSQTETSSPPESKNDEEIGVFLETGSSRRRRGGKKAYAESRRCSTDRIKKSMTSILKQPDTGSKHGVLGSWGKIKKREGGARRRARKFVVIS